jgi:hypothetical protein
MSRRLTPEEKALRLAVANQNHIDRENKKKEKAEKLAKDLQDRQHRIQQRAILQAKKLQEKQERDRQRADKKAEKEFNKRLKQAAIDEALEFTIQQVPVIPPNVDWSVSNIKRVRSMLYILNGYLDDMDEPPPRDMGMFLYEIVGVSLGVYTVDLVKEIKRMGTLDPCVEEHPYGRNNSGEIMIDWFKHNRKATLVEVCTFVERFVQFTYSTDAENNGPLKKVQNKNTSNSSRHWKDIYEEAGVRWVYIHFPPGPRTAKYITQCGELLGIC